MSSEGGMMKCVCLKDEQPAFRQTCPLGAVFTIQCKCLLVVLLLFFCFFLGFCCDRSRLATASVKTFSEHYHPLFCV